MSINTTQIANLLKPGLACIFGDYAQYNDQWKEIYEIYQSDKAVEQEVEMRMLSIGQIRPEGSPTAVDNGMGQRNITSYLNQYVGLSFSITRQAQMDNLYKSRFPMMAKSLKNAMRQTKNILGANILNNGFDANFPIGDGQPLLSINHPIDTGVFANTFAVQADLNEGSLESAIIQIQQFRDLAGNLCMNSPKKMIVPPQGQFVADRLLGSAFRTGTTINDISSIHHQNSIPEGFKVNHYLTLPNSWYILTDADNGFKHYVREAIETDVYTDFSTDNLLCKAIERYSFGVSNPRIVFACNGP
jgi:hypothetical protein